jgi:hypothetical protein
MQPAYPPRTHTSHTSTHSTNPHPSYGGTFCRGDNNIRIIVGCIIRQSSSLNPPKKTTLISARAVFIVLLAVVLAVLLRARQSRRARDAARAQALNFSPTPQYPRSGYQLVRDRFVPHDQNLGHSHQIAARPAPGVCPWTNCITAKGVGLMCYEWIFI